MGPFYRRAAVDDGNDSLLCSFGGEYMELIFRII